MDDKIMLECKICGCKFNAIEERHYISRPSHILKAKEMTGKATMIGTLQGRMRLFP